MTLWTAILSFPPLLRLLSTALARFSSTVVLLSGGIEDRAGWRSDPFRTAQNGAVKIRYSASAGPGVHFPGFFGRAAAQLHDDLAAEGGFNVRLSQQLSC